MTTPPDPGAAGWQTAGSRGIRAEADDDTTLFAFDRASPPPTTRIAPAEDETLFAFGPERSLEPQARPAPAIPSTATPTAQPPERYGMGELIGRGGMSEVYVATDRIDPDRGPPLAIKLLKPELRANADAAASLQAQASILARLDHPNIARFVDSGEGVSGPFIVTERVIGPSLGRMLRERAGKGMEPARAIVLLSSMADALAHAHGLGIVHADIKPGNILIGSGDTPKLIDFGVPMVEGPGASAVTPAYASAELAAGETPTVTDDVFSLAVVVYELLAGRHPFDRKPAAEAARLDLPRPRPPGLTGLQWRALRRGLSWRRADRPQSIEAFAAPFVQPAGLRRWLFVAAAVIAAGIASTLAIFFSQMF